MIATSLYAAGLKEKWPSWYSAIKGTQFYLLSAEGLFLMTPGAPTDVLMLLSVSVGSCESPANDIVMAKRKNQRSKRPATRKPVLLGICPPFRSLTFL